MQAEQDADVAERRDRLEQRPDEHLQLRQDRDHAERTEQASHAEHGGVLGVDRHEADRDDQEVEHVPRLLEILPRLAAAGDDLQQDFANEAPEDRGLNRIDDLAGRRVVVELGERLHADENAGDDDQQQDEVVEPLRFDDPLRLLHHTLRSPAWSCANPICKHSSTFERRFYKTTGMKRSGEFREPAATTHWPRSYGPGPNA